MSKSDDMFDRAATAIGGAALFCGLVLCVGLLIGYPIKWLWNWLMPELFGLKTITFAQAWGLAVLCNFLFKSDSTKAQS